MIARAQRARIASASADSPAAQCAASWRVHTVHYLRDFPKALHHPKEEGHLFRLLRQRTRSFDAELDELEQQHERNHGLVLDLVRAVEALAAAEGEARMEATRELEEGAVRYADFHWEHMGREEAVILPAALRHLSPEDWRLIDEAYTRDPRICVGSARDMEFHHLVAQIVAVTAGVTP